MTAKLTGLNDELNGQFFEVEDRAILGRSGQADIFLPDATISRTHAEICKVGDGYELRDLKSRLGVFVDDQRVDTVKLQPGQVLTVGRFKLKFELAEIDDVEVMQPDDEDNQVTLKKINVSGFNLADEIEDDESALPKLRNHLRIIQAFGQALQSTFELQDLLNATLRELFRVFTKMDGGVIYSRHSSGKMEVAAAQMRETGASDEPPGISKTILNYAIDNQESVLSLDAQADSRFQQALSVRLGAMRTHMCVPLVAGSGGEQSKTVGAIYAVSSDHAGSFSEDELSLLTALAGPVAVAVKNAQLIEQVAHEAELRTGLARYVPSDVASKVAAGDMQLELGGQNRNGTAMFCDVVGFTTLSQKLAPGKMVELLNQFFEAMNDLIFQYEGSINKFGGDAILAVWGAVVPLDDHERKSIEAAIRMQNALFRLNYELVSQGNDPLLMTIGANSGEFFAGNIGAIERMEFTVIGDTINVAARIQAKATEGQILATDTVINPIKDDCTGFVYKNQLIRGRTGETEIWSIRAVRSADGEYMVASIPITIQSAPKPALVTEVRLAGAGFELYVATENSWDAGQALKFSFDLQELGDQPDVAVDGVVGGRIETDQGPQLVIQVAHLPDTLTGCLQYGNPQETTFGLRTKKE